MDLLENFQNLVELPAESSGTSPLTLSRPSAWTSSRTFKTLFNFFPSAFFRLTTFLDSFLDSSSSTSSSSSSSASIICLATSASCSKLNAYPNFHPFASMNGIMYHFHAGTNRQAQNSDKNIFVVWELMKGKSSVNPSDFSARASTDVSKHCSHAKPISNAIASMRDRIARSAFGPVHEASASESSGIKPNIIMKKVTIATDTERNSSS